VKKRIVLLGPPASGKGTQAEMISVKHHIGTASPGAMLREELKAGTPLGIEAERVTSRGQLMPDSIIVGLVKNWLQNHDGAFIFDGFPRTLGQADGLETLLAERGTPLDVAFSLDADFETIRDRVERRMVCPACGNIIRIGLHVENDGSPCPRCDGTLQRRKDDNVETLWQRMQEYREKSESLVSLYEQRGILKRIDAKRKPDEVFADIEAVMEQ
jgi:adenylate kinase